MAMKFDFRSKIFFLLMDFSLSFGLMIFISSELVALRNHVADALVTMFIFSLLTFFTKRTAAIAGISLAITVGLECVQALKIFQQQTWATELFIGHTFDPIDLIIYVVTVAIMSALHDRLAPRQPDNPVT
jgi:hypothetical protein